MKTLFADRWAFRRNIAMIVTVAILMGLMCSMPALGLEAVGKPQMMPYEYQTKWYSQVKIRVLIKVS